MLLSTGRFFRQTGAGPVTPTVDDPHFASVVLLVSFDGADGATTATDDSNSAHSLTFVGNAQIDTAQSKFGGASLLLDGAGDRVSAPDSTNWHFGAGQFTVEAWVRFNALPTGSGNGDKFLAQWSGVDLSWAFGRPDSSSSELNFITSSNGSTIADTVTTSGAAITTGTWYHLCAERDASNNLRIYVNGVMRAKATVTTTFRNAAETLAIGAESSAGRGLNGWIDEIRITNGVARYASDSGFTPPTAAYPRTGADAGILAAVYFTVSGTTPTIVGQKNVSSVTRQATGVYRITFTSALAHTNYGMMLGGRFVDAAVDGAVIVRPNRNSTSGNNTYSTTTVDVVCQGANNNTTAFDPEKCGVVIFDPQTVSASKYLAAASWTVSGTTVTLQRQLNVASMSRHAAGTYRTTFNSALADANYSEFVMSRFPDFTNIACALAGQNRNTTIPSNLHSTAALDLCTGRLNVVGGGGTFEAARGSVLISKSSVAPAGTVARVRFSVSGGVVTIVDSYNVASVTRHATGLFRVNFSAAAADADYVVFCSGKWANSTDDDAPLIGANRNSSTSRNVYSTTAVDIVAQAYTTNLFDPDVVDVWVVKPWLM